VNLLGASVLDGFDRAALETLEQMLETAGLALGAIWGAESKIEVLAENAGAVNWVISAAALPLARYLEEHYSAPFAAGLPVGEKMEQRLMAALCSCAAGDSSPGGRLFPGGTMREPDAQPENGAILVIGEALFCASLRLYLEEELGTGPVRTGTFFAQGKELLREGDCFLDSEEEAAAILRGGGIRTVIADPLVEELLAPAASSGERPRFIGVPHRAISGRLYNESRSRYLGAAVKERLGERL
jgi:hypothetical protein